MAWELSNGFPSERFIAQGWAGVTEHDIVPCREKMMGVAQGGFGKGCVWWCSMAQGHGECPWEAAQHWHRAGRGNQGTLI